MIETPIVFTCIHTLNVISIKFFLQLGRLISKSMWRDKYARTTRAILQKQQKGWDLSRQLAKQIIKLGSRQIDQWTRKSSDRDLRCN